MKNWETHQIGIRSWAICRIKKNTILQESLGIWQRTWAKITYYFWWPNTRLAQRTRLDIVCTAILGRERGISGNHVIPMQVKKSWISIHHGIDQFLLFLQRQHQPPYQTWGLERMKIVEFETRALHPKAPLGELRVGLEGPGPGCAIPYCY
jgi:hypothetical protein